MRVPRSAFSSRPVTTVSPESSADIFQLHYIGDAARREAFIKAWQSIEKNETIPWTRVTKKGERQGDVRDCLKKIVFTHDDSCTLHMVWETGYVSPLALVRAAMTHVGADFTLSEFSLMKLRP